MRACADPRYKRVVAIMGSQMSKTDGVQLNVMGHRIDDDPAPVLYIGPTRSFVEKVIEPRVMAMCRGTESIWSKFAKGKKNQKTQKVIGGVKLRLAWAGSATELAGDPAAIVMVDERDRMGADVGGEGDIVEIADARHSTYPDGKTVVTSTPKTGVVEAKVDPETGLEHWQVTDPENIQSPIWKLWQEGTRHEWAWPCPHCREYFIPRFKLLWWPEKCTPQRALKEARMTCPHCAAQIDESSKNEMNARGVPVAPGQRVTKDGAVTGDAPDSDNYTIWVSGLCSPWRTFGQRARAFLAAVRSGDSERIQGVINTGFGELYRLAGDEVKADTVASLKLPYTLGTIPTGVQKILLTVDVQKNRLLYTIRGWGVRLESWLIRHGEIYGETEHDAVWLDLEQLIDAGVDGSGKPFDLVLIDSGYRPGDRWKRPDNQIYAFCRRNRGRRVRATKGHASLDKPFKATFIDVTLKGRVFKGGLQLWHLDVDHWKGWVHGRLEWPAGEPGAWHIAQDTSDDYCKQITAEARAVKPSGHVTWIRIRKENHYLDCEAMQAAGAHMLGVHNLLPLPPLPDPAVTQAPVPVSETNDSKPSSTHDGDDWIRDSGDDFIR